MSFIKTKNIIVLSQLLFVLMAAAGLVLAIPESVFAASEKLSLMDRSGILSIFYGIIMVVSMLLAVGYFVLVRERNMWFMLLFTSILMVNTGYFLLSVSVTLSEALWANRLSYLGSVYLPFFMLMIIMNLCNVSCHKFLRCGLLLLGFMVFLLAASGGICPLYYESVALGSVDGISVLIKDYGPLHFVYLIYLLGYFAVMLLVIFQSFLRKKPFAFRHAIILACLVLVNLVVWFFEQKIYLEFEFLSISYILTELFLLMLYCMIQDYEQDQYMPSAHLGALLTTCDDVDGKIENAHEEGVSSAMSEEWAYRVMEQCSFVDLLTGREQDVLRLILENNRRKDIAELLHVSENTVKKHTSHIFTKLEVSNRKELYEKIEQDLNNN